MVHGGVEEVQHTVHKSLRDDFKGATQIRMAVHETHCMDQGGDIRSAHISEKVCGSVHDAKCVSVRVFK